MTFIRVPSEPIRDLDELFRLALKYIFVYTNKWDRKIMDPMKESMSLDEVHQMQSSIVWWATKELPRLKAKTERKIFLFKATADEVDSDIEKYAQEKIQLIGYMLGKNDEGKFDMTKEQYYFKSIDYRKVYNLPGSKTEADYARGAAIGAESDKREGIIK